MEANHASEEDHGCEDDDNQVAGVHDELFLFSLVDGHCGGMSSLEVGGWMLVSIEGWVVKIWSLERTLGV